MAPRVTVVVGYDDADLLDIAAVTTTLDLVNESESQPAYDVRVVSPGGTPIRCTSGLILQVDDALERVAGPLDTLVIVGGRGPEALADDPPTVARIRRLADGSRRVASVCTGATILAATGLLDGRRATTHWAYARRFADRHPTVDVDPNPIYIREGNVFTAAGITSAVDLTLALVEADLGAEIARRTARTLVTYLQRPGNQAQMSLFVAPSPPNNDVVRQVVDHISSNLDGDLTAPALSSRVGVSERHLTRLFVDDVGETPGRYVRRARTEAAAHVLVTTSLPVTRVASRCGFGTAESLRQAFVKRYGITPARYRATQTDTA